VIDEGATKWASGGLAMEQLLVNRVRHAYGWMTLVVSAILIMAPTGAAQPKAPQDSDGLSEVLVTASKLPRETLNPLAIEFVRAHAAESPVIHQIGRWHADLCPRVSGLQPAASAFVSHRVTEVARSVGASASEGGKGCAGNVQIVFTSKPQQLLDHIARSYPELLGSSRSPGDATSRRAIQSWYVTGTKVMSGWTPPAEMQPLMMVLQLGVDASTPPGALASDGARVDPASGGGYTGFGSAASYFTHGFTSELLQVFIVVDTDKVAGDSLSSISDYIAMLALTRMHSLDDCSKLPSIIDLLSSGCGKREKPMALTETDTAYLKALYSANLEKTLNLEQGDIRDKMVAAITGQ
jgi:hypothetical protein